MNAYLGNMHACNMYIFDGFGSYVCVFLTLVFVFWGWSFSIACYIEYVWNVYEAGMAYALVLPELCQDCLGGTMETLKEHQK